MTEENLPEASDAPPQQVQDVLPNGLTKEALADLIEKGELVELSSAGILSIEIHQSFRGPTPPPDVLEAYDRIVPGSARQIFDLVQQQSEHRRSIESNESRASLVRMRFAQWSGLGLAFLLVVGGVYVFLQTQTWAGMMIGSIMVVAGVGGTGAAKIMAAQIGSLSPFGKPNPPSPDSDLD